MTLQESKDAALEQIDFVTGNRKSTGFEITSGGGVYAPLVDPDFWIIAAAAANTFDYSGGGAIIETVGDVLYRVASTGAMNSAAGRARDRWVEIFQQTANASAAIRSATTIPEVDAALAAYLATT